MTARTMISGMAVLCVVGSLSASAREKKGAKPAPAAAVVKPAEPALEAATPAKPRMTMTTKQELEYNEQLKQKNDPKRGTGVTDMQFYCKDDALFVPISFDPEIVFAWEKENGDGAVFCSFSRYGIKYLCDRSDKERTAPSLMTPKPST